MPSIVVLRTAKAGSIASAEYSGPHLSYSVDLHGRLTLNDWVKGGKSGDVIFAAGHWVCAQIVKDRKP